jgi:hypothetical protein
MLYKKTRLKGQIALHTIFYLLLAVITIFLLVWLFSNIIPSISRSLYCHVLGNSNPDCKVYWVMQNTEIKPMLFSSEKMIKYTFSDIEDEFFTVRQGLSELILTVTGDAVFAGFDLCNDSSYEWNISQMDSFQEYKSDDLASFNCSVIHIHVINGTVVISYKMSYRDCDTANQVLSNILACWESGDYGNLNKDLLCSAIRVKACPVALNEKNITELLITKNLCNVIENSEYGCGTEDNLEIENINSESIIVEYTNKRIRVS